jgi:hypothetical protein
MHLEDSWKIQPNVLILTSCHQIWENG